MKETLRMVGTLMVFGLAAGFLLAWTQGVTAKPIAAAQQAELSAAIKQALPACDNDPVADQVTVEDNGVAWTFFVARQAGQFAGAAFKSAAPGYGGPVAVMVAVRADGAINRVLVVEAAGETPGLGSKAKEPKFLDQFKAFAAGASDWSAVRKDGGQIDAITGATITSRAVTRAVKAGLEVYGRHEARIRGANP